MQFGKEPISKDWLFTSLRLALYGQSVKSGGAGRTVEGVVDDVGGEEEGADGSVDVAELQAEDHGGEPPEDKDE